MKCFNENCQWKNAQNECDWGIRPECAARVSDNLNSLVRNHFYWVEVDGEGWKPAQYAGGKDGHYFWPIGIDYEYKLGRELLNVGDEIICS